MADSVLASAIILGARERANDETDEAIATDTEVLRWLRQEWKRLYGLYVSAEPDRFRTVSNIGVVAGTATYALPATWFATISIDYIRSASGNQYDPLRRLQEPERLDFDGCAGAPIAEAYRLVGTNVELYATPTDSSASYRHTWVPTAPDIASEATAVDVRNGHDVYLEMLLAKRLLQKEEAYDSRFEATDPNNPLPGTIQHFEKLLLEEAQLRYMYDAERQFPASRRRRGWLDEADYRGRR